MEIVSIVDCLLDDEEIKMPAGQPDFQSSAIHIRNEESSILDNTDLAQEHHGNSENTVDVITDTKQLLCNNDTEEELEKVRSSLSHP